jgi:hypothetical protein
MSSRPSGDFVFPSSARHICPPNLGLSSTTVTCNPSPVDAATAADIPAGPPPTIKISVDTLITGYDLHSVRRNDITTALMSDTVDRHTTLKTDPHTANRSTRFAASRLSKSLYAGIRYRRGDGRAVVDSDGDLIDGKSDQCSVMTREGK